MFFPIGSVPSNSSWWYSFEIEFGGEIHKIQGNLANDIFTSFPNNQSISIIQGGITSVQLSLDDISESNYVSGQTIGMIINIDNATLGNNEGSLFFNLSYPYVDNYLQSLDVLNNGLFDFVENSPAPYGSDGNRRVSNINITDLGTPSSLDYTNGNYIWGETIKGSYDGMLYFRSSISNDYDIPVPIRIEFSAVRLTQ